MYSIKQSGIDTGRATSVVKIRTGCSTRGKRSANCLCISTKTISYVKLALEGVKSWCEISCPLLSLRIVFGALLLCEQNECTAGH